MRKEEIITINDRGNELTFRIREMPATQLEGWLFRVGTALASTGFAKTEDIADGIDTTKYIANFLVKDGLRFLGNLDYEKVVKPLVDDLYSCVEQKVGRRTSRSLPITSTAKLRTSGRFLRYRRRSLPCTSVFSELAERQAPRNPPAPRLQGSPNRELFPALRAPHNQPLRNSA